MSLQFSILSGLAMFVLMLGGYAYSEHTQKVSCHDKAKLANSMAEEAKKKYVRDVDSYEYAIKEISEYFIAERTEVENFTKDKDETDCDAANRLLNSFKY